MSKLSATRIVSSTNKNQSRPKVEKDGHSSYGRFAKINGQHPLMQQVPDFHIEYQARTRKKGKLSYFNYDLARDIGLIDKGHSDSMNKELEKVILHTFGIIIINEYDQANKKKYSASEIRQHKYMATRYLQLQHKSKVGKTSGDGRSIWNGTINNGHMKFDISSRGTGATCLSPAASSKKKFFQNGDTTISYGCGMCDLDEAVETALFSEILHKNGIRTERVLTIVEYPGKMAVVVRAHPNLLRPSHFFRYLKQGNLEGLKALFDYHFEREQFNGNLPRGQFNFDKKLDLFLNKVIEDFAYITAAFEDEYIFCWLDWDGDNILMDGSIIDYGSIRQFGLFHHEYRYDDVQRFSTSILEQKLKAKIIVQNFIQMVDFLRSGEKRPLKNFQDHSDLKKFDKQFAYFKDFNLLKKMGLPLDSLLLVTQKHKNLVRQFRAEFSYFERVKSKRGRYRVPDGISWDAVFCMRDILRELPQVHLKDGRGFTAEEFIDVARSNYARPKDLTLGPIRRRRIARFQNLYSKIVQTVAHDLDKKIQHLWLEICMRSSVINKYDRVTGNGVTTMVNKLMGHRPKLEHQDYSAIIKNLSDHQLLDPDKKLRALKKNVGQKNNLLNRLIQIVRDLRESI